MRRICGIMLVLLLLFGGASQCLQDSTTTKVPDQPPTSVPYDRCAPLPMIETSEVEHTIKPGDYFVEGQIILTGRGADVNRVAEEFPLSEPINRVDMEYLAKYSLEGPQAPMHFPRDRFAELTINLYRITDPNLSVGDLITKIYTRVIELKGENEIECGVFADPNYLTGSPPSIELSGDPYCPDCVEGSPAGGSSGSGAEADSFWSQWALGEWTQGGQGIGLVAGSGSGRTRVVKGARGRGVRVGIFDTSPFKTPGEKTIPWIDPPLTLCVYHPGSVVPLNSIEKAPDFREHGLFVAGLVHAVAPDSEIHLIRVLDEKNRGDLDTLINTIDQFTTKTLSDRGTLNKTVLNLSLGVHTPPDLEAAGLPRELPEMVSKVTRLCLPDSGYEPLAEDGIPIVSLRTKLSAAYDCGAVVVAASGNDSSAELQPAQLPAAYAFVIGVAGSNSQGNRAGFSNAGDVAAPSGDRIPGDKFIDYCNGETGYCYCQEEPRYCLISLATKNTSNHTGYAYWIGTSFAAPLVSGQAALLLGEEVPSYNVAGRIKTTARQNVDVALGAGIIDVPASLSQ